MSKNVDIKSLKPKNRPYKVGMGKGLYLFVQPTGSKHWRMKCRFEGKEGTLTFGSYPQVSYKEALEKCNQAQRQIKNGINPVEVRRTVRKEKLKPKSAKSEFRMDISPDGSLTIENATRIIRLNPKQALALKTFLNSQSGTPDEADKH